MIDGNPHAFDEIMRDAERTETRRKRRFAVPDWITNFISGIQNPDNPTTIDPGALPDLAGDVTGPPGANTVVAIQGVEVSATPPTAGQVMTAIDADSAEWDTPSAGNGHIIQDEGTPLTARTNLNFTGDSVVATDDAGNDQTDVAINHLATAVHSVAQPVAVHKNGTLVGTRKNVNLIEGSGVTLTVGDDAGDDEVDVTITADASGTHDHGLPSLPNPPAAQGGLYSLLESTDGPVLVENTSSHDAFPGLTQMSDGRLILVYRLGTSHVGDKGSIKYRLSNGLGRTWESAVNLYTDATFDVRDPSITRLWSGRLLLTFQKYDHTGPAPITDGGYTTYSDDMGVTWSTPVAVNSGLTDWSYSAYGPPVQLPDGSLRLCGYGEDTGDTFHTSVISTSTDQGESWGGEVVIADGQAASRHYSEPQLVRLLDGTLYVTMRSDTASQIWASVSTDDGATWGAAASKFSGSGKPALVRLADGLLVCIYRKLTTNDVAYRTSTDDGATWSSETVLYTVGGTNIMVYAAPYELADAGGVLAVAWGVENAALTDSDLRFTYLFRGNTIDPLNGEYVGAAAPSLAFDDLTDVVLTAPATGQVVRFDGADWVNEDLPASGGSGDGDHEHMVDVFVGDASTTAFELTDEPLDPEAVVAFVAGAETAVTMSGVMNTTATFGAAPGAAARVTITYPAVAA
jgi:hypothetical protein